MLSNSFLSNEIMFSLKVLISYFFNSSLEYITFIKAKIYIFHFYGTVWKWPFGLAAQLLKSSFLELEDSFKVIRLKFPIY